MKITIKKILLLMICICFIIPGIAHASNGEEYTIIELDLLKVTVPYSEDEITIEKIYDENYVKALVYDMNGNVIEEYTEEITLQDRLQSTNNVITKNNLNNNVAPMSTAWRTLTATSAVNPTRIITGARVLVYSSGSFRSIQEVDEVFQYPGESGIYSINNPRTYVNSSTPTTRLSINIVGNISTTKTRATSHGLNFQVFQTIGWNITGSEQIEWTANFFYNKTVTITV